MIPYYFSPLFRINSGTKTILSSMVFTNGNFLTSICPVRKKLEYLFLLSMRPANDLSARIPHKFLTQEQIIWAINNPFIKTIEDKIVFVPELIRNKGEK
jgi:hypothetical protein